MHSYFTPPKGGGRPIDACHRCGRALYENQVVHLRGVYPYCAACAGPRGRSRAQDAARQTWLRGALFWTGLFLVALLLGMCLSALCVSRAFGASEKALQRLRGNQERIQRQREEQAWMNAYWAQTVRGAASRPLPQPTARVIQQQRSWYSGQVYNYYHPRGYGSDPIPTPLYWWQRSRGR